MDGHQRVAVLNEIASWIGLSGSWRQDTILDEARRSLGSTPSDSPCQTTDVDKLPSISPVPIFEDFLRPRQYPCSTPTTAARIRNLWPKDTSQRPIHTRRHRPCRGCKKVIQCNEHVQEQQHGDDMTENTTRAQRRCTSSIQTHIAYLTPRAPKISEPFRRPFGKRATPLQYMAEPGLQKKKNRTMRIFRLHGLDQVHEAHPQTIKSHSAPKENRAYLNL
ncbi:hypothetical protein K458DRAFT_411398 [Lentithecium fluviatile CBS 122367]|uniref:Uncharacterized protein n=1 Tax=Lentithecium fluviatile CBS 122367 TaxID=1168545 RepID=A0A6G1JM80_9PLEO|nr:hypothetical protein K458DRAFT_411398 [Lentithecium fluviatile CBS 122367]